MGNKNKIWFHQNPTRKDCIFLMMVFPPRISIPQISSPCDILYRSFNPNLFTLLSLITTSLPLWLQSSNSTTWGDPFLFTRILLIPANCWRQCDQTVWGKDTAVISFRIKLYSWAQWNYPIVLISQKKWRFIRKSDCQGHLCRKASRIKRQISGWVFELTQAWPGARSWSV